MWGFAALIWSVSLLAENCLLMAQKCSLVEHWDTGHVRLAHDFKTTKTFSTLNSSKKELTLRRGYRRTVMGSQGEYAQLHSCNCFVDWKKTGCSFPSRTCWLPNCSPTRKQHVLTWRPGPRPLTTTRTNVTPFAVAFCAQEQTRRQMTDCLIMFHSGIKLNDYVVCWPEQLIYSKTYMFRTEWDTQSVLILINHAAKTCRRFSDGFSVVRIWQDTILYFYLGHRSRKTPWVL